MDNIGITAQKGYHSTMYGNFCLDFYPHYYIKKASSFQTLNIKETPTNVKEIELKEHFEAILLDMPWKNLTGWR